VLWVLGETRGEADCEARGQAHHATIVGFDELAFRMSRVEVEHRGFSAAAAMVDYAVTVEAHDQMRTGRQCVESPIATKFADEVLRSALPRQAAGEGDPLGAQVVGVEYHDQTLGIRHPIGAEWTSAHRLPHRPDGEWSSHFDDQPARAGVGEEALPSGGHVAKTIAGIVEKNDCRTSDRTV